MADNVAITAGAGTSIATDDIGGVQYQIVKPAFGALDSATLVSPATPLPVAVTASTLAVTATGAAAAAVTLTLPAAGAGLFQYITSIEITLYSAAARTGAAAPWVVTTTNLPGAPAWTFNTAGAIGTNDLREVAPNTPLRSSVANTATTIVAPIATGGIWRLTVMYFTQA